MDHSVDGTRYACGFRRHQFLAVAKELHRQCLRSTSIARRIISGLFAVTLAKGSAPPRRQARVMCSSDLMSIGECSKSKIRKSNPARARISVYSGCWLTSDFSYRQSKSYDFCLCSNNAFLALSGLPSAK